MKHVRYILALMVALAIPLCAAAQSGVKAAPEDSVDRLAPDFVKASVCIANPTDWRQDMLGVCGHAFIRLQCPTYGLDYCYSYESESASEDVGKFLLGRLSMGMYAVPTKDYLQPYRRWHCGVHEYELRLPPDVELHLWQLMDHKVMEGADLRFDLMRRGCAQTLVNFVEEALGDSLAPCYGPWPAAYSLSRRQLVEQELRPYPWMSLAFMELLYDNDYDEAAPPNAKIIFPRQIVEVWPHAVVEGKPLMSYVGDLVSAPAPTVEAPLVTPLVCSIIFLLFNVFFAAFAMLRSPRAWKPYVLGVMACVAVVGLALHWLFFVSNLPGSRGAMLLILYNPLPFLLWRWRRFWGLWYVLSLVAWGIVVVCMPRYYVNPAHVFMAASVVVLLWVELHPSLRHARP